jgi:hypothetical protein
MRHIFLILGILCLLSLFGCTNESRAQKILDQEGYTEVSFTGYKPFACSEDDSTKTGFSATSQSGSIVTGVVCCGLMKGCTIRYD